MPLWAAWMRSEAWGRGYPSHSSFLASGGVAGEDAFGDLCDKADGQAIVVLDALINDLPAILRAAVHHRWLAAVFRFRPGIYERALAEAVEMLDHGMRKWGMGE
jgi:hypothetical protein